MRRLIPHARRIFRLTLPAVVFMWLALPAHACAHEPWSVALAAHAATADAATAGSMPVDCGHCPPRSDSHCVKPGPGSSDSRPLTFDMSLALVVLFIVLPVGGPKRVAGTQRLERPRIPRRPLHLEKRVLLI